MVSKTFTINGKAYKAREFDFNLMADFENYGVRMDDMEGRSLSFLRAYFACCSGLSAEDAGKELQAHMIAGDSLDSLSEAMNAMMVDSGFFRALQEQGTKEKETKAAPKARKA